MKKSTSRAFLFASGIAGILLISLVIFYFLMRPPLGDLGHMAQFLSITATISIIVGYAAYALGWLERAPSLRWVLLGSSVLASLLTFLNVWLTARLMFASQHDLLLATVLLVFAGGISVALGCFFTSALIDRIARLEKATHAIENNNFEARADISGNDEIAGLATSFNRMAQRLQNADQEQKDLEILRRDLVAWAGHDLRTPLSSIRLLVDALSDGMVSDPETTKAYLLHAKKQVDVLSVFVEDLFQISQLDAGKMPLHPEPASMCDLISDTLESFSRLASKNNINLSGTADPTIDPITVDVQWMGRALNNLVGNALRYTPPGGSVTLCADLVENGVAISVSDTGEGILPEDLPYIFERFFRGEKSRNRNSGGAGLGLAIVKGIVEAHAGSVQVESEPGQGSVFTIILPKI